MISIVVPVYNVEPYLKKCIDSIRGQSFSDLEILLIDDGSTDGSGRICDEYAETDSRIRVVHTEKRGVSEARNRGIEESAGEWIGFVDPDDWIEADMYECLLQKALETGADIAECGILAEKPDRTETRTRKPMVISGGEAVRELLRSNLGNVAWDKLYRRKCFETIRFPAGRLFEDVATTYRVLLSAERVCTIEDCKYHYIFRKGSLSLHYSMRNLAGFWLSHKERYDFLRDKVSPAENKVMERICAKAAARTWAHYYDCPREERQAYAETLSEMSRFVRQDIPLFGRPEWGTALRAGVFLARFNGKPAYLISRMLVRIKKNAFTP